MTLGIVMPNPACTGLNVENIG